MNLGDGCVLAVLLLTLNDALYHVWSCFPEIAQVIASYTATGPEQLTLAPGQLILIRKKNPGGWWEGELQVGVFSICLKSPAQISVRSTSSRMLPQKVRAGLNLWE